ncbi:MAG: small GTP-binding protein [Promethearchaeota archaeon CR_4]|nr:MAG: small GTP-binding protein [Candidatus Lokiarchaeota archaeon CR_4]
MNRIGLQVEIPARQVNLVNYDITFKLVLFGDGAVGKTALTQRYLTGLFKDDTKITIGVEFHINDLEIANKRVKLQIWDFGGEERFRFLLPSYCKGANGGIFMFDVTNTNSLHHVDDWMDVLRKATGNIPIMMVGTKVDLAHNRAVNAKEAMALAKSHKFAGYAEVSAKTGVNVESVFETIAEIMIKRMASK